MTQHELVRSSTHATAQTTQSSLVHMTSCRHRLRLLSECTDSLPTRALMRVTEPVLLSFAIRDNWYYHDQLSVMHYTSTGMYS
jgi:hypothetical protein